MRVVIAGGGEVGTLIASRLGREGNEIVIIEEDAERAAHLEEVHDAKVLQGSAASPQDLRRAGLPEADMIIAVTDHDEINLLACLIAHAEFGVRVKVARVRSHEAEAWRDIYQKAGLHVDLMIHPESEAAKLVIPVLQMPGISEIIDFGGGKVKLFGLNVEPDSWMAGKSMIDLAKAGAPKQSLIAMIFRGTQVIIPHGAETLQPGDHAYVIAPDKELENLQRFIGLPKRQKVERAFILGGKQIGIMIAGELEGMGVRVKLFETDARRCEKIASILHRTIIVHGDGKDAATLMEENIEGVDAYLALTGDDEDNLIAALLARRLGAKKVVALVNRMNYLDMAQRLGIHTSISPRLVTVDRILQFVRKGRVLSVTTFGEEAAEAIELEAAASSPYVGKNLKDVRLPREVVVGAILRTNGEVLVPRGDDSIHAGDRVIFFALETAVAELERVFLTPGVARQRR